MLWVFALPSGSAAAAQTRRTNLPSFGEQLRQARESQNITLQEIAATTKISARSLQALESEQFDQLPGGIFNKGFVRAYARYVGLDEDKMLAAYMAVAKHDVSETDMETVSSQIAAARRPPKESRIGGTTVMGVLAIIVALVLGGLWFREHRREAREQAALQAAQPAAPVASAPQPTAPAPEATSPVAGAAGSATQATGETAPAATPAGTFANSGAAPNSAAGTPPNAGTAAANPAANATPKTASNATASATSNQPPNATQSATPNSLPNVNQRSAPAANVVTPPAAKPEAAKNAAAPAVQTEAVEVSISATQQAWISVRSDGKPVESLTLDPDNPELRSRTYKAKEKLRLVVGNAGGVTAVCNGKSEGVLGAEGQAKTITFTSQGIQKP